MSPLTHPTGQGKALPIAKARLKIGDFDQSKPVAPGDKSVVFTVPLKAGKTRLQTWFYDQSGNELCGAFYAMAIADSRCSVLVRHVRRANVLPRGTYDLQRR